MSEDDNFDDAPEGLTGEDFAEYVRKKQESQKKKTQEEKPTAQGQNIRTGYIPKNQQDRRELNRKLRDEQKTKTEQEQGRKEFETKHPYITKGIKAGKKAVEVLNKKTAGFIEDSRKSDQKLKEIIGEMDRNFTGEESPSSCPIKKKKLKSRIPDEDEEEEEESPRKKSTKPEKFWDRDYQPVFAGTSLRKQTSGKYKSSGIPSTHPEIGGLGLGVYIPVGNPRTLSLQMNNHEKHTTSKITKITHATGKIQKNKVSAPTKVTPLKLFSIGSFKPLTIPNTSIRIKSLSADTSIKRKKPGRK